MPSSTASDVVTITGTGYSGPARQQVRHMAELLRVRYSGDLTYGITTHLVAKSTAHATSDKTAAAHAWGIPVLLHSWLAESVQVGYMLPAKKMFLLLPDSLQCTEPQPQQHITTDTEPEKLRSDINAADQRLTDLFLSPTKSNSPGDALVHSCLLLPGHCDM